MCRISRVSAWNPFHLTAYNLHQKKLVIFKKNHEKNKAQSDFMAHFLKIFGKKNRKFSKKNFFESCYFIFEHGEKKKFFFWKISRKDFSTKFQVQYLALRQSQISEKKILNFFSVFFMRKRTTFWIPLVRFRLSWHLEMA